MGKGRGDWRVHRNLTRYRETTRGSGRETWERASDYWVSSIRRDGSPFATEEWEPTWYPRNRPPSWPEKTRDVFLSVNGLLYVTTHSRKPKARHITAWLVRDVLPRMHNSVVTKHQAKIARHEVKLLANGVKMAYQQKQLVALNKEQSAVKKDLQTLRIRAMADTIKAWGSTIDRTTVKGNKLVLNKEEDWDRDQYECCPANLIKTAAAKTIWLVILENIYICLWNWRVSFFSPS